MVQGGQHHVVTQENVIPDGDAPLVLEAAAGVDKHPLAQGDVLAKVRGKGGEEAEPFVHRFADELGEEGPQFLSVVIPCVDLCGDLLGLAGSLGHKGVDL